MPQIPTYPAKAVLSGTEIVPIVDGSTSKRTTTGAIADLSDADVAAVEAALAAEAITRGNADTALGDDLDALGASLGTAAFTAATAYATAAQGAMVPTRRTIPAGALGPANGVPTLGITGKVGTWNLDPATTEGVGLYFDDLPPSWDGQNVTVSIKVAPAAGTPAATAVVVRADYWLATDDSAVGNLNGTVTSNTAVTQSVDLLAVGETMWVSLGTIPYDSDGMYLRILRLGGDVADTFASDLALVAARFTL